jgi:LysM repeat protein
MRIERADLPGNRAVENERSEEPRAVRREEIVENEPRVEAAVDTFERDEELEDARAEDRRVRSEESRELQSTLANTAENAESARNVMLTLGMRESAVEMEDVRDEALDAGGELNFQTGRERVGEEGPLTAEELSTIGRGLDPKKLPPQAVWNEEMVNTYSDRGRAQSGISEQEAAQNADIADKYKFEEIVEYQPADVAALLKESGGSLEKTDPNQLVQAADFINEARDAGDQQERIRKTLDTFTVLENRGAPKLDREQMKNQLWAMAKVPGHAIEKLSDAELGKTFQEVAGKLNAGPGQSELKIGSHKLKITVDANGEVTDSSCKKPGFVDKLKTVGKIALTVASFIPGPVGIAARITQGVIAAVSAAKNKNLMGFVGAAASAFGAGAAALGGSALSTAARVANGVASTARGIQSVQRGGIAGIIGGAAGIAGGIAQAIGDSAERAADQLQRVSNRLQPVGSVEAIRNADRTLDRARDAVRQAEASGDPRAIQDARAQMQAAERAHRSSLFGGLSSVASLGADLTGGSGENGARTSNQVRFEAAARGFDVARGINERDLGSIAAAGLGLGATLNRGTSAPEYVDTPNGQRERFNFVQSASDVADGVNGYRLSAGAARDAAQNVRAAETSLARAEASGDSRAIRQAREDVRRARLGASDAELARFYSLDVAAGTVHRAYGSFQETRRSDEENARRAEASRRAFTIDEEPLVVKLEPDEELEVRDLLAEEQAQLEEEPAVLEDGELHESWQMTSRTHEIQPGDRLEILADRYGVTVEELRAANGNVDPRKLRIGEDLIIPGATNNPQAVENLRRARANANPYAVSDTAGGYYTVQRGETLSQLSRRTGVSENELVRLNPQLAGSRMIFEGQSLVIPQVDLPDPTLLPNEARLLGDLPGGAFREYVRPFGVVVNENGVAQGQVGDCYMMASLASIARVDPDRIRDAVRDNLDGTYTVRFYERNEMGMNQEVFVDVDGQLPRYANGGNMYAGTADDAQQWAPIIEKAYARRYGSYQNLNASDLSTFQPGLSTTHVLQSLTGYSYRESDMDRLSDDIVWNRLQNDIRDKLPLVVATSTDLTRIAGTNLVDNHAYSVLGTSVVNGQRMVEVRNPWGSTGPGGSVIQMPFSQFRAAYPRLWAYGNQVPTINVD